MALCQDLSRKERHATIFRVTSMNQPKNISASVRQKLKNIAFAQREDFQAILTRYALEKFLYRLSQSQSSDQFVLKGALLLSSK